MKSNLYRLKTSGGRILFVWDATPRAARNTVRRLLNPEDGYIMICGMRQLESVPMPRKKVA